MVKIPVATTFATALPLIVPNIALATMLDLAAPPAHQPQRRIHEELPAAGRGVHHAEQDEVPDEVDRGVGGDAEDAVRRHRQDLDEERVVEALEGEPAGEPAPKEAVGDEHADHREQAPAHRPAHALEEQREDQRAEDEVAREHLVDVLHPGVQSVELGEVVAEHRGGGHDERPVDDPAPARALAGAQRPPHEYRGEREADVNRPRDLQRQWVPEQIQLEAEPRGRHQPPRREHAPQERRVHHCRAHRRARASAGATSSPFPCNT
jgi:hypothetical protein